MKIMSYALAAGLAAALTGSAMAADITGAGATFPFPVYAKWAEAYKKETGNRPELSVDRLRRRHPPDPGQDRRFRRDRCAAEGRGAREGRLRPVPDRAWAASCRSCNIPGVEAGQLKLTGEVLADIFNGKITKWNDPKIAAAQPGRDAARRRRSRRSTAPTARARPASSPPTCRRSPRAGRPGSAPAPRCNGRSARAARATRASPRSSSRCRTPSAMSNTPTPSRTSIPFAQLQNKDGKFVAPDDQDLPGRRRQRRLEVGSRLRHLADQPAGRRGLADHRRRPSSWSPRPRKSRSRSAEVAEVLRLGLQERRQDRRSTSTTCRSRTR